MLGAYYAPTHPFFHQAKKDQTPAAKPQTDSHTATTGLLPTISRIPRARRSLILLINTERATAHITAVTFYRRRGQSIVCRTVGYAADGIAFNGLRGDR